MEINILTRFTGSQASITISATITVKDTVYSVTSIGQYAFYNCNSLTSITIPDSVTSIGSDAFSYCNSLTIYAEATSKPSGWSSNWNYDGRPVYWGINANNYIETTGLQYVIQDGKAVVTRITSTATNIDIPSSVNIGGTNYSVTSIGDYAFIGCTSLTSIVIPDSVTSIGEGAFGYCTSLTSIVIPDTLTSIGGGAFYNCSSLTNITIPNSVTSIGSYAFSNCNSLKSIVIPDSVTSIGSDAFSYCNSLTIYAEATSKPSGWDSFWNYSNRPVYWEYVDLNTLLRDYSEQLEAHAQSLNAVPENSVVQYKTVILGKEKTTEYAANYNFDPSIDLSKIRRGLFVQVDVYAQGTTEFLEEYKLYTAYFIYGIESEEAFGSSYIVCYDDGSYHDEWGMYYVEGSMYVIYQFEIN